MHWASGCMLMDEAPWHELASSLPPGLPPYLVLLHGQRHRAAVVEGLGRLHVPAQQQQQRTGWAGQRLPACAASGGSSTASAQVAAVVVVVLCDGGVEVEGCGPEQPLSLGRRGGRVTRGALGKDRLHTQA